MNVGPKERVRHVGEQWPGAFAEGTATVIGVVGGEVLVRTDAGRRTSWAAEATVPVPHAAAETKAPRRSAGSAHARRVSGDAPCDSPGDSRICPQRA